MWPLPHLLRSLAFLLFHIPSLTLSNGSMTVATLRYQNKHSSLFQLVESTDNVLCDVVPMSACHILLGRPWQFDRHVMHDGFKKTYSLIIDKEKIILNSLPPNQVHKSKPGVGSEKKRDLLMLSETRVERALSKDKQVLALLMLKSNNSEEVTPLHPKIIPLISQYKNVFPQDLPPASLQSEALSIKLTSFPVLHFQTKRPIDVTLKRPKSFKGKLMSYWLEVM